MVLLDTLLAGDCKAANPTERHLFYLALIDCIHKSGDKDDCRYQLLLYGYYSFQ